MFLQLQHVVGKAKLCLKNRTVYALKIFSYIIFILFRFSFIANENELEMERKEYD